ncbi:MAG: N-acetyl-gamma-glutamyl-phosphate reductase [Clostridia bacterium]|nr:N-acetyl-gamma-glutamyl-phosphate reductase [Clostridia bacterium]
MTKVFIDGSAGTTGLRIFERLRERRDIELMILPDELRKDEAARSEYLHKCDAAFLCLPDDAARQAAKMAEDSDAVIIDASTAHRTEPGWAYGFPELSEEHKKAILTGKRLANPGCHASGFVALVYPLREAGLLGESAELTCTSLTGYSGGGKKMIADYEADPRVEGLASPREYGIGQTHKHLKEMKAIPKLANEPVFLPIVAPYYNGMLVTVPLFADQLACGGINDVKEVFRKKYTPENGRVIYKESIDENGFVAADTLADTDGMEVTVAGNAERIILMARFDNLGKGASGSAIQLMDMKFSAEG